MWGTSWRQRLRLTPLLAAMAAADGLAALLPAREAQVHTPWEPGITVLIPERDAPAMLARTLESLTAALDAIDEPHQVIVVANGAPRATYRELAARFPAVEWDHVDAPLGFGGAIERGLRRARHDGTYLLNNDMTLDARALAELLPLRAPDVFALASQIFQQDATGRREETGFTDWYANRAGAHLYHAPAPSSPAPHLCASGGAALFRTAPLARYVRESRCYDPFYWEDAEWGVRGWQDGMRVLFVPSSHATHAHRMTTARYYSSAEIDRIVERNRWLFTARHGVGGFAREWMMARACDLPYASQRELARCAQAAGVFRRRLASARSRRLASPPRLAGPDGESAMLRTSSYSYRLRVPDVRTSTRLRLLVVTPFAVFPPRHGGARRVAELLRGLRERFDIALVTDEAALYDARSFAYFSELCEIHFVQRKEASAGASQTLRERLQTHCHPALVNAVTETLRTFTPHLVVVEHAELADLVRLRTADTRWVLDLHDAYAPADFADRADAGRFAQTLASYDALAVCSDEDGALLAHPRIVCIPNGSAATSAGYQPSASQRLLFVGPFRYGPNRDGILRFLRDAWPAIRSGVPQATLLILAGDEHVQWTAGAPAFAAEGVQVSGHRDDVPALLAQCALTINPLEQIRGSAVKLVESLAGGRICVTTKSGARGFASDAPPGLVVVPDVAAMTAPIVDLLTHPERRHALEFPAPGALGRYAWDHGIARLAALLTALRATQPRMLLPLTDNYDRIARFYDVDMARNMPFDDVGFYVRLCQPACGPVLELGCGNGRILLELQRQGIDATGIDASAGMLAELQRKAALAGLSARAVQMDLAHLDLRPGFALILCPYSLITYITVDDEVTRLLERIRGLLAPAGVFIIDAFVPRPALAQGEFREDYRRPFGAHTLVRAKRVAPLGASLNRIERRYRVLAADGAVLEQVDVTETIRPCSPAMLRQAIEDAGLAIAQEWWDYGARGGPDGAQFFTLAARAPHAPD